VAIKCRYHKNFKGHYRITIFSIYSDFTVVADIIILLAQALYWQRKLSMHGKQMITSAEILLSLWSVHKRVNRFQPSNHIVPFMLSLHDQMMYKDKILLAQISSNNNK
jgi:hypothetical protein